MVRYMPEQISCMIELIISNQERAGRIQIYLHSFLCWTSCLDEFNLTDENWDFEVGRLHVRTSY